MLQAQQPLQPQALLPGTGPSTPASRQVYVLTCVCGVVAIGLLGYAGVDTLCELEGAGPVGLRVDGTCFDSRLDPNLQ